MAATKRNAMLIAEAREKIRTTQLINRLQDHAFGTVEMTDTQIKATAILLKKSLPDLQAITHSGDPESPIKHEHSLEAAQEAAKAILDGVFGEKPE